MNGGRRRRFTRSIGGNGGSTITTVSGRRHKPDYWILILTSLLMAVGLVVVFSISPGLAASQNMSQGYFVTKQIVDVVLGLIAFAIAAYLPTTFWSKITKPLVWAAVASSIIVMLMPIDSVYQAHRWIRVGGLSFQVAELIKLALLLWAAGFLSQQWRAGKLKDFKTTIQPILMVLLALGVVVSKLQSDLGSAAVMIAMLTMMAFSAGIQMKRIAAIGGVILVLGTLAIATSDYRRERLVTYLNPEADCLNAGYQACQALRSVGSGGLFGLGLGHSVQAFGYLPEASDDSIFAIVAEKFGFIGTSGLVILYGAFITRLKVIIERLNDQYLRLIVVGVLAWMSTQMIINIGAMLGLLPLKGITLPLISQGGTSLVFLTAALGMVFNISRYTSYSATEPNATSYEKNSNSTYGRRVGRPYSPPTVARPRG